MPAVQTPSRGWIAAANDATCEFPIQNLPSGLFSVGGEVRRLAASRMNAFIALLAEDGAEIVLHARTQGPGYRIGFGPCTGRVLPAQG